MYSLSSLISFPNEEYDVLGEDELALLTKRFKSATTHPRECCTIT
jgi:hypothetical protein